MAKKNKTKVNLLRILLDDDQQIALDVYCMKRGVNKSEFCRRAIRQELDRVTSPTFVEEKIEIHIPVSATPRTYAERVAKRQSEELKKQTNHWQAEQESDMRRRQQTVFPEGNLLSDDQQRWLDQNFKK
jgi:hypothetical protein